MPVNRIGALAALCALLSGCSATGPIYTEAAPPPDQKALIYVYRMPGLAFGAKQAHFYLDGIKAFDLNTSGYSYLYVSAGDHILSQNWEYWPLDPPTDGISAPITVRAGETRYFRFSTSMGGGPLVYNAVSLTLRWQLKEYPEGFAKIEIKKENFQKPNGAYGSDF